MVRPGTPADLQRGNGVIADLALSGEYALAAREAARAYADSLAFHNEPGYPAVLLQQNVVGRCEWLRGKYDQATAIIGRARAGYDAIVAKDGLSADHPWRLANRTDHVLARRDGGASGADLSRLGVDHPHALACEANVATMSTRLARDG